jgi:hypothetical protein
MWRRNGATAANLAYNYSRAPLSKALHDMDLVAMQASLFTLSPDSLLALAIDRFELTPLLNNYQLFFSSGSGKGGETNKEFQAPLLNEFLRVLIHLVTNTPVSLVDSARDATRPTEGCARSLGREIVHHVLSGVTSAGQLQKVKSMIGTVSSVSDVMLAAAIDAMCVRKAGGDEGDAKTLSLRPESYLLYDPEYATLNTQQASVAADRMRERVTASTAVDGVPVPSSIKDLNQKFAPLVTSQALPVPCAEFTSLRCVLFRPLFFSLLHRSLRICLDNPESTAASRLSVIGRVIHLVTLQVICIETPLQSAVHLGVGTWNNGTDYFSEAFKETAENTSALGSLDACVEMVRTDSGLRANSSSQQVTKEASVIAGAGRPLLAALAEVWLSGVVKDDILYHQGLGWLLQQVVQRSEDGKDLLRSMGISVDSGAAAADADDAAEKKRKRMQAQQRAILESQKRAAAFAAMADDDSDDDEDDDEDGEGGVAEPEPECIVCREKKSDSALGLLCFLQPSHVLKNALKNNNDCPELRGVYRVVAMAGCEVFPTKAGTGKPIHHCQQSDHITTDHREGAWVRVIAPVTGWCAVYSSPVPEKGAAAVEPVVNLVPVSDLQFNRHGGARLHGMVTLSLNSFR